MQQFVLNVRESESAFLAELLAKFEFVEIVQAPAPVMKKQKKRTAEQQLFLEELKGSIQEMELHREGKLALPTFEEMMQAL